MKQADCYYGRRGLIGLVLLTVSLLSGLFVHQRMAARTARAMVTSLLSAPASAVPYAIEKMKAEQEHAVPEMRKVYGDSKAAIEHRFLAAIGLANLGDVRCEFLVDAVVKIDSQHSRNLISALRNAPEEAVDCLSNAFRKSLDTESRAKYATIMLHLGEPDPAYSMLKNAHAGSNGKIDFCRDLWSMAARSGSDARISSL